MNAVIVSYSFTGNNRKLAECMAEALSARHIEIEAKRPITMGAVIMDMIFSRTPKVYPAPDILRQYDLILLLSPVWMGQIASPLRAYLSYLKINPKKYGFLSISGGAEGKNPKLSGELLKRTGVMPVILLDQHIKDLLPSGPQVTRKETSAYKISETESRRLSDIAVKEVNKFMRR